MGHLKSKDLHFVLLIIILMICASCEVVEDTTEEKHEGGGIFLLTSGSSEKSQETRAASIHVIDTKGSMTSQVEVTNWDANPIAFTRTKVTGDEVEWHNTTELSIYITDATNSENALIARNLAMNPVEHTMFENFYDKPSMDSEGKKVEKSSFFWEADWSKKDAMKDKVNFYGFYPRPVNSVYQDALAYIRNSIILQEDATGQSGQQWNLLHYAFIDQTDDNMTWHDIMCSVPENEGVRYGNQGKSMTDNIQLHYKHMFSLLDIDVNKGEKYKGDCMISSMELSGTQVFTEGTLDLLNATVLPMRGSGNQEVKIARLFDAQQIKEGSSFHKTMIVQPTQDGDNPNNDNRLILTCCIDGVNYACSFPTLKLEAGKRYKLNLTLTPAGVVAFKIWRGAKVKIGNHTYLPENSEEEITTKLDKFSVDVDEGYRIVDILKNGKSIYKEGISEYTLEKNDDSNTNYNIVACPIDNWYITKGLQLHYDGMTNVYNASSNEQNTNVGIWYDLSGSDNDGTLRSFTATSGWKDNGLVFDGLDDIVYFSGKITPSYTMEFYVCVEPTQRGAHPRFVAEGNKYPCFYFYGTSGKYDGVYTETSQDHILAFFDKPNKSLDTHVVTDGHTKIQLDFAYDANTKILTWYVDGKQAGTRENVENPQSIDIASIGNRYIDNSRAMAATYYSFMVYNTALQLKDIEYNYNVNKIRYGTTK